MSRRPSIQNAQDAIHLFPSDAASGRTLSSRISLNIGPSSPSYARVMAIASCRSPTWFIRRWTASRKRSARRKNAAAYSDPMSAHTQTVLVGTLTKPPLPEQRIRIFKRGRLPPRFPEVIRQQARSSCLLTVPVSYSPESLQDILLPERKVI